MSISEIVVRALGHSITLAVVLTFVPGIEPDRKNLPRRFLFICVRYALPACVLIVLCYWVAFGLRLNE